MGGGNGAGRLSDLHKSAFWIYGVTAMVMREPLAITIRHAGAAGIGDPSVRLEVLRVLVVLALITRLFLASGLYFDEVYLRPDSLSRYPRQSYPVDFLFGLLQFLLAVGASTAIATTVGAFPVIAIAFLLFENLWWAASAGLRYSSTRRIGATARSSAAIAVLFGIASGAAWLRLMPEEIAFVLLLVLIFGDVARLIRAYDAPGGPVDAPPSRAA